MHGRRGHDMGRLSGCAYHLAGHGCSAERGHLSGCAYHVAGVDTALSGDA